MATGHKSQHISFQDHSCNIARWQVDGVDIFFPRQELEIGDESKWRGGMHPCFPNFGEVEPKYGLPKHGPLRDTVVVDVRSPDIQAVYFEGAGMLGSTKADCKVSVDVEPMKFGYDHRGFTYTLCAAVPEGVSVPVNAGLHPYFRTPQGTAIVYLGQGGEYKVRELIPKSHQLTFRHEVTIVIPGVGVVVMSPHDEFCRSKHAYFNVWRDSLEYFCLEPVLAPPDLYGGPECPQLAGSPPGSVFRLGCSFRLHG